MRRLLPLLLLIVTVPAISAGTQHNGLLVKEPWIQEAPPGVSPLAGYMTLENTSKETIVLTEITSPDFERVEIHQSRIEGEVAKMDKKDSLSLSSGQIITLEPGSYHLMLFRPAKPMRAGAETQLTLRFKTKEPLTINIKVRSLRNRDGDHSHHNH